MIYSSSKGAKCVMSGKTKILSDDTSGMVYKDEDETITKFNWHDFYMQRKLIIRFAKPGIWSINL